MFHVKRLYGRKKHTLQYVHYNLIACESIYGSILMGQSLLINHRFEIMIQQNYDRIDTHYIALLSYAGISQIRSKGFKHNANLSSV